MEIIIVDDCSTDGTKEFVKKVILPLDSRIGYLRHSRNKGLAAARNLAILNAKGKYFTFCDDDDVWKENFIIDFIFEANKHDDNWCFVSGYIYDSNKIRVPRFECELSTAIKEGYTPPVASQFYHTKILKEINGYNENIKSGVDHDLWLKLACHPKRTIFIKGIEKANTYPNRNKDIERITTSEANRLNGIKNSLKIWKNQIEDCFGKKFYIFFSQNYMYYLNKGFIKNKIKEGKYLHIRNNIFHIPIILFLKDINRIRRKRKVNSNTLYPTFFKFHEK